MQTRTAAIPDAARTSTVRAKEAEANAREHTTSRSPTAHARRLVLGRCARPRLARDEFQPLLERSDPTARRYALRRRNRRAARESLYRAPVDRAARRRGPLPRPATLGVRRGRPAHRRLPVRGSGRRPSRHLDLRAERRRRHAPGAAVTWVAPSSETGSPGTIRSARSGPSAFRRGCIGSSSAEPIAPPDSHSPSPTNPRAAPNGDAPPSLPPNKGCEASVGIPKGAPLWQGLGQRPSGAPT